MRQKTIDALLAHAEFEYPRECCGVVAQKSRVERYFPCRNLAPEPTEQFHMSPEDYAEAEEWGAVIGIAHSHPDATTRPSPLDEAMCDSSGVPWHIVSWPEGDLRTIQPRDELPLIGRPFVLGHSDCWGLVMSYFRQEQGIELPDFRVDYPWWEDQYPENLYQDNWQSSGFVEVTGAPQPGDVILMQVQSNKWNHAGVMLEGNMMLHHIYGRVSNRIPYGGYWQERTMKIVRHEKLIS